MVEILIALFNNKFQLLKYEFIFNRQSKSKETDSRYCISNVKLRIKNKVVNFFVNHFRSRWGGQIENKL